MRKIAFLVSASCLLLWADFVLAFGMEFYNGTGVNFTLFKVVSSEDGRIVERYVKAKSGDLSVVTSARKYVLVFYPPKHEDLFLALINKGSILSAKKHPYQIKGISSTDYMFTEHSFIRFETDNRLFTINDYDKIRIHSLQIRRTLPRILDLRFYYKAIETPVNFKEFRLTSKGSPRDIGPNLSFSDTSSFENRRFGGFNRFFSFSQSVLNEKNCPNTEPSSSKRKDRHSPIWNGVPPRIKIVFAGYRWSDIFLSILIFGGFFGGSMLIARLITGPRQKNDRK